MPKELVAQISPESGLKIKNSIKLPVILLTMTSGLCGGTTIVMLKSFGQIVNGPEVASNVFLSLVLVIAGIGTAIIQVYMLNLSMKYYDNIDVMPMYQSFTLINWMLAGLVLLDESSLYSWGELFRLCSSCLFVILGIFVLTLKHSEDTKEKTEIN